MSHIARVGSSKNAGADRLGPVAFECRDQSWVNLQLALGRSRPGAFLFLSIAASLCVSVCALLVCVVALRLVGFDVEKLNNKTMLWSFIGVSSSLCCSVIYWSTIWRLRRPRISLALHEHGIRYKRKTTRFDELRAIRTERESRGNGAVEHTEAGNADSLTFVLKDGRIISLRGIARRSETEDFKQFMSLLSNGHSHLFDGVPPTRQDEHIA